MNGQKVMRLDKDETELFDSDRAANVASDGRNESIYSIYAARDGWYFIPFFFIVGYVEEAITFAKFGVFVRNGIHENVVVFFKFLDFNHQFRLLISSFSC